MKKIGLIGDPHAFPAPVREALDFFRVEQVDAIWCTGDIAGYGNALDETVQLLRESGCKAILGNHEQWYLDESAPQKETPEYQYLKNLPSVLMECIEGKSLYMVHASPPDSTTEGIRLLDQYGHILGKEKQEWTDRLVNFEYDILIVGHTHQVFAETLGRTFVINPGSTRFNHSCAVLKIPDMCLEWYSLSGHEISRTWNWGVESSFKQ